MENLGAKTPHPLPDPLPDGERNNGGTARAYSSPRRGEGGPVGSGEGVAARTSPAGTRNYPCAASSALMTFCPSGLSHLAGPCSTASSQAWRSSSRLAG